MTEKMNFTQEWDKTFKLSEEVEHKRLPLPITSASL